VLDRAPRPEREGHIDDAKVVHTQKTKEPANQFPHCARPARPAFQALAALVFRLFGVRGKPFVRVSYISEPAFGGLSPALRALGQAAAAGGVAGGVGTELLVALANLCAAERQPETPRRRSGLLGPTERVAHGPSAKKIR